jgi:GT2 family glycosyltransferase
MTEVSPLFSVIILNRNGTRDTIECVRSHLRYSPQGTEIIVWDNGSKKEEVQVLQNEIGDVAKIFECEKNIGVGPGFNSGAKESTGKLLVFQSSDTEVTAGWAEAILEQFTVYDDVGVCQPKILQFNNKDHFDHVGGCGGYLGSFGFPFTRGSIFDTEEEDSGQYDEVINIHWADSACMIVRHDLFTKIHGFDERYFVAMDEIDLSCHLRQLGYRIVVVPQAVLFHKGNHTWSKASFRMRFHLHRNNLLLLLKNLPALQFAYVLSIRLLILEPAAFVYYICKLQLACAAAIPVALVSFLRHAPAFWKSRISGPQVLTLAPMSIAVEYFLKGKRTFSSLNMPTSAESRKEKDLCKSAKTYNS